MIGTVLRDTTIAGECTLTFEGYHVTGLQHALVKIAIGWAMVFGGWLVLALWHQSAWWLPWAWGLWFGLTAAGIWRISGPRSQHWGQGTLAGDRVAWMGQEQVQCTLASRRDIPAFLGWGPRLMWGGLIFTAVGLKLSGLDLSMLKDVGSGAIVLMLAWQAWITPVHRTVLTVVTGAGRRKIYVTKFHTP